MDKLINGNNAPSFSTVDLDGNKIQLIDYEGKKVLLSFFRFSPYPFCTIRFTRLQNEAQRYADQAISIIAVFESSQEYIRKYLQS